MTRYLLVLLVVFLLLSIRKFFNLRKKSMSISQFLMLEKGVLWHDLDQKRAHFIKLKSKKFTNKNVILLKRRNSRKKDIFLSFSSKSGNHFSGGLLFVLRHFSLPHSKRSHKKWSPSIIPSEYLFSSSKQTDRTDPQQNAENRSLQF